MSRIFVVDDDAIDQLIFIKLLTTFLSDVEVVAVSSFMEPVKNIFDSEIQPTFLIVNIDLMAISSWSLLEQLNELQQVVPVYLASHWITPSITLRASKYPFVRGLLEKPLSEKDIARIAFENNLNFHPYTPTGANS
jgi:FixJ family two-component response regulator